MLEAIKNNPVRLYAIAAAALALAAYYMPSLPVVLIMGLVAAILGVGEGVRAQVTPVRKLPPPPPAPPAPPSDQ
jgi:predicted branched-subunit amino acid permease